MDERRRRAFPVCALHPSGSVARRKRALDLALVNLIETCFDDVPNLKEGRPWNAKLMAGI
jgi:hypothetical protein